MAWEPAGRQAGPAPPLGPPRPQASFSLEVQVWAQTREVWTPAGEPLPQHAAPTLRLLGRLQIFWSKLGGPAGFLELSNPEGPHLEGTDSRQASKEPPEGGGG